MLVSHNFNEDDRFTIESEGALPGGLSPSPNYFVHVIGQPDEFEATLTASSSAVGISDYGAGTNWLYQDPTLYWTQIFTIP